MLIKPLVFCIKGWDADVYDSNFSYGPMTATGFNKDGSERPDRDFLAVELHLAGAFENEVDFGQFFVIVRPRIFLNIDDVQSGRGIVRHGKGSFCTAAGTFNRVNLIKMCCHIVCHISIISFKLLNSQPARCIFCLKGVILSRID